MTAVVLAALLGAAQADSLAPRVVDDFEHAAAWTAHPADGVELDLRDDRGRGRRGRALRMDFRFTSGGGYAIARRTLDLVLPPNYAFSLWIRGEAPPNTLEFKLVDPTGENVWWFTERDRAFDGEWHRLTIRKRQIGFAWGPAGGGELRRAATLELVITAGRGGGTGSVWFDDLVLSPLPVYGPYEGTPIVKASASLRGHPPSAVVDGDTTTSWRTRAGVGRATVTIDFGRPREFGGLTLVWEAGRSAPDYDIQLSDGGRAWRLARRVRGGDGGRDHLFLPDSESRYVRLMLAGGEGGGTLGYGLREVLVRPLEFSASRNAFFEAIAREAAPGTYPRYFGGERAYWTVVGANGAEQEALINEDGAVDAGPGAFSVEPLLSNGEKGEKGADLVTWRDATRRVWLEEGDLPIPTVEWTAGDLTLTITAFAVGTRERSSAVMRYRIRNRGSAPRSPTLYLVVRPFQVNPPWQFLNVPGGVARVDSIRWTGRTLRVNADRQVFPLVAPSAARVSRFDDGEMVERLRRGRIPPASAARDPFGAASAVLSFPRLLAPGDTADVAIEIPLVAGTGPLLRSGDPHAVGAALVGTARMWRELLDRVTIALPPAGDPIARTIRSTVGWVLVNRDGPAIQPGSRSYERSWIRDGALTSAALLRFGHPEVVREFIEWYAGFQYPNGKVPCCVDDRGADPVPEHDSHGEFIYLVMEYWRHTADRELLQRMWPRVVGAVRYIDSLRQSRRTDEFRSPEKRHFFGLLPPSISHEGYSAKPMHSYWDDFFTLRGLKDAAAMALVLGHHEEAVAFAAMRDEFRRELLASLALAMERHRIDYLPGAADLGDFDATSTTIALSPVGEEANLPRSALERTFERYWDHVVGRQNGKTVWEAYTPYELRTVGAMLRLGWKDRALTLLDLLLLDREPPEWNLWPEVVWRDRHAPKFIGDAPHTWVGSDFLRSAADLFAFEREADSALVVGAGLAEAWLEGSGVEVRGLRTWWGPISYTARADGDGVRVRIEAGLRMPPGGIVVKAPGALPVREVRMEGGVAPLAGDEIVVRRLPADLRFVR